MRALACAALLASASAAPRDLSSAFLSRGARRGSAGVGRRRGAAAPAPPAARAPPASRAVAAGGAAPPSVVSVLDFGADATGAADSTAAFQAALDSLAARGGEVTVPDGNFTFQGSLAFPPGLTLSGTFAAVPSHDVAQGAPPPARGSVLIPRGGRGNASGAAFLALAEDCAVRGLVIWHDGNARGAPPAEYPYAISLAGNNAAVEDVELLNPWNGISAVKAARHYIARVQGQPANIGIFVDETYDIGRIEDVHWNPWWDASPPYVTAQLERGVGFVFARTDWEYVLNTFVFGMSVGYNFVASATGSCNGNFAGIGADCCSNASIKVDAADPYGILVTNGEFTSFSFGADDGADHAEVVVTATNAGAVRFSNSAFWGPAHEVARIDGGGSVGFESCVFSSWDARKAGRPAIALGAGGAALLVRGCDFQTAHAGGQLVAAPGAGKVIFTNNLITGALNVTDGGARLAIVKDNAPDV